MENPPAHFPAWPGDAEVAVALTFDVDGEAPWLSEGSEYARRLTTLSQGRFGPARGLGRILGLLAELDVTATFYVPGHTADQHPGAVEAILAGGHEVAHHGYLHRGTDGLDAAAQRAELEEGLTALGKLGVRPDGYRSPGWELTPETLGLLGELGFSYDASLMADDRPYWVTSGTEPLLELPGHWSLCDWPYFGWTSYDRGLLADPAAADLAGRVRVGPPGRPGGDLHDAPRGHRPRLPGADAGQRDHRDGRARPPVVRHARADRGAGRRPAQRRSG